MTRHAGKTAISEMPANSTETNEEKLSNEKKTMQVDGLLAFMPPTRNHRDPWSANDNQPEWVEPHINVIVAHQTQAIESKAALVPECYVVLFADVSQHHFK